MVNWNGNAPFDTNIKILLLGDGGAGKTSLLMQYTEGQFNTCALSTIGVDFKIKTVTRCWEQLRLQIWDTSGQERYRSITQSYYRGSHGVILVYDRTDEKSFGNVRRWMNDIRRHGENDVKVILVASKFDAEAVVDDDVGRELAKECGVQFFATSSKTNYGVHAAFESLVEHIYFGQTRETRRRMLASMQKLAVLRAGAAHAAVGAGFKAVLELIAERVPEMAHNAVLERLQNQPPESIEPLLSPAPMGWRTQRQASVLEARTATLDDSAIERTKAWHACGT